MNHSLIGLGAGALFILMGVTLRRQRRAKGRPRDARLRSLRARP